MLPLFGAEYTIATMTIPKIQIGQQIAFQIPMTQELQNRIAQTLNPSSQRGLRFSDHLLVAIEPTTQVEPDQPQEFHPHQIILPKYSARQAIVGKLSALVDGIVGYSTDAGTALTNLQNKQIVIDGAYDNPAFTTMNPTDMQLFGLDRQPLLGDPTATRTFVYSFTFHDVSNGRRMMYSVYKTPHPAIEKTVSGILIQVPTDQLRTTVSRLNRGRTNGTMGRLIRDLQAQSRGGIPTSVMDLLGIPVGSP
jgi:hypothetical protein